mmetsp:Transcript_14766/g.24026  ORF Transcript_14766/g.24026 Transcript_14766/m.24026 type:complete len:106 (-) Transcript_14766:68-385(-)
MRMARKKHTIRLQQTRQNRTPPQRPRTHQRVPMDFGIKLSLGQNYDSSVHPCKYRLTASNTTLHQRRFLLEFLERKPRLALLHPHIGDPTFSKFIYISFTLKKLP